MGSTASRLVRFRVSSRALGERETVYVFLYDTAEQMQRAGSLFNQSDQTGALGITQCWTDDADRAIAVIVRLARPHLATPVVVHEMHHATTALYGAHVGDRISRRAHLNHHNEPFAHFHGELVARLVDHLYRLGCYLPNPQPHGDCYV